MSRQKCVQWSVASKNRYIALLKLTYRLAEKNRKLKFNPARLLRQSKADNTKVRYLNQYKPLPTKIGYLKGFPTPERSAPSSHQRRVS